MVSHSFARVCANPDAETQLIWCFGVDMKGKVGMLSPFDGT